MYITGGQVRKTYWHKKRMILNYLWLYMIFKQVEKISSVLRKVIIFENILGAPDFFALYK